MFIQTENTPNPQTIKFLPGETILEKGTKSFENQEDAKISPLASALFSVNHVKTVFFGTDFISITKSEQADWSILKPEILTTIMEHFVAGHPIFTADNGNEKTADSASDDDPITKQIKEILDSHIRPAVANDGGDIVFHSFDSETGTVYLEMHGACSGCPSSTITLKNGIENLLKHYIPEVNQVESVR